jgi:hypothetical protein
VPLHVQALFTRERRVISRRKLLGTATAAGPALAGLTAMTAPAEAAEAAEAAEPGNGGLREKTTVEYAAHPLGLDAARPRLSWILGSDRRDHRPGGLTGTPGNHAQPAGTVSRRKPVSRSVTAAGLSRLGR